MPVLAAVTAPYFFLSYAHRSHGDGRVEGEPEYWVGELFRELCRAVQRQAALPKSASPGFMDRERRVGDEWPAGVVGALGACRVFVPLYSSRYFTDENCGREWNFFTHRRPDRAEHEAAIVPVIWDSVEAGKLPEAARTSQFWYRGSEAYENFGLFGLMKVSRYRKQYEEAVGDLARLIVTAAVSQERQEIQLDAAGDPSLMESAFSPAMGHQGEAKSPRVRVTVAAPQRDELPCERVDTSSYGASALEWNPYATDPGRSVRQEAAAVARSLHYEVDVGDIRHHLDDLLSGDARYGPQILIVDPWASLVPSIQHLLQRIDDCDQPWLHVIIPWDATDEESRRAEGKLRVALGATFPRKLAETASVAPAAAHGVPSVDEFDDMLSQLVGVVVRKYLRYATAYPPVGELIQRPRLIS